MIIYSHPPPNAVIDSIDLEPTCNAIAVSWVQTEQTGEFDYKMEAVPPSQLQAAVAADGAASRIVTAVTFDDSSGDAILISYGWSGDTATVYEAKTVVATPTDVANQATILAGEGYFISAFGGNDTDGYMLIGMRVQGDSLPRPITGGSTRQIQPTGQSSCGLPSRTAAVRNSTSNELDWSLVLSACNYFSGGWTRSDELKMWVPHVSISRHGRPRTSTIRRSGSTLANSAIFALTTRPLQYKGTCGVM